MTPQQPVPGDVLFFCGARDWPGPWRSWRLRTFRGVWQKAVDLAIMRRTGSDVVHVAVVVDLDHVIQAVSGGVELHALPANYAYIARVGAALAEAEPGRFDWALRSLCRTVGSHYGWQDVLDQALRWLPGSPCISFDKSYDCSHLAAAFLETAGYPLPFGTVEARITPADLLRLLQPEEVPS